MAYQEGRDSRRVVYEQRNRRGAWTCYDEDVMDVAHLMVIEFEAWKRVAGRDVCRYWSPA